MSHHKKRVNVIIDIETDFVTKEKDSTIEYLISEDLKDKGWIIHEIKTIKK